MVPFHIVYYLDKRLVFVARSIQNKGAGMAYDAPPLPVAMALGGELPEQGMFLVHQQGEGARRNFAAGVFRNAFEHGIVPVVRSKKSTYTLFFNGFVVGYKQYLPSLAQSLSRLVIQGLTDEDVRFAFRCPVGVYP